jgi:hypothetical protein
MRNKTENRKNNRERGVALLFVLFTLLLISAIAVSLVFMTNTETSVNSNYRLERVSSFAAKAGMEEVRDRMPILSTNAQLPVTVPPLAGSVLYVLNEGGAPGTVQPWTAGNTYMDDELCHDFAGVQAQQPASDVRCTTPPTAAMLVPGTLAAPVTSNYPWSGTTAALPYKWARVTLKLSNSVQNYPVNGASPTTQVCWNGATEVLLNGALTCQTMVPSTNPVYMITSLASTATGTTRRMVQAEVALSPAQPFPYGLYATGNVCPALNMHGNPTTDSFNSKNGGTYAGTASNTLGDVGANGGVSLTGNATVGGAIGVISMLPSPPAAPNPCSYAQGDYTNTPGAGWVAAPGNGLQQIQPQTFPTPPDPVPAPLPGSPVPSNPCVPPVANTTCAVPGTYGAISLSGKQVLSLAPGVYNIYSISLTGNNGSITINPPGAVVLNFPSASPSPISIAGNGIANPTGIANNFQMNYGGTGVVSLSGNGQSYAIVDAPNAAIQVAGNGEFFGRIIGKTIDYGGNGKFHFDKNSALGPSSNGGYNLISFREVTY